MGFGTKGSFKELNSYSVVGGTYHFMKYKTCNINTLNATEGGGVTGDRR